MALAGGRGSSQRSAAPCTREASELCIIRSCALHACASGRPQAHVVGPCGMQAHALLGGGGAAGVSRQSWGAVTDDGMAAKVSIVREARGVIRRRQLPELLRGLVRCQVGALDELTESVLGTRDVGGAVVCEALPLLVGHDEEVDIDCEGGCGTGARAAGIGLGSEE